MSSTKQSVSNQNNRRLPTNRTKHIKVKSAIIWQMPKNITLLLGEIGLSYAFKMPTMYGRIDCAPVNSTRKNNNAIMKKGFKIDLCFNSASFSVKVGDGWEQCLTCLMHVWHAFDRSLCRLSSLNSSLIASFGTQPRSQLRDFCACFVRCFDRSHWGVSGIWKKRWNKTHFKVFG